jgi:hypothetical protein
LFLYLPSSCGDTHHRPYSANILSNVPDLSRMAATSFNEAGAP